MRIKMVKGKGVGIAILALALAALLLFTACATTPPVPTGEKVVKVGALPCLTGGGGTADQPSFRGTLDYVRYFNEEKGIPGVTIEVMWMDQGTDVSRWISGYRKLVDYGVPLVFSNLTLVLGGIGPQLEKDQIPLITGGALGPAVYPPGWIFAAWATQGEAATAVLDYFMENWKEERSPRLQLFVSETTFGREPAEEATKYAESIGFEVLPLEISGLVVIDATPQLLRIREREADLVYIQNIISAAGPIMRDVERLGLQDKMQFAGTEWIMGVNLIDMAPVGVEGFLTPRSVPLFDETEVPGIKAMTDAQLKYHGKVQNRPEYVAGWIYGAIICEAVKLAVEEVGYENVDGLAVKRSLESMKDFDIDGMVKITYGPEDRRGSCSQAVNQVQGGKIVRVSDYREVPILVP